MGKFSAQISGHPDHFFPETGVDSKIYGRVTDGKTTDADDVYSDLADDLEEDASKEDAIFIKICEESQVQRFSIVFGQPDLMFVGTARGLP